VRSLRQGSKKLRSSHSAGMTDAVPAATRSGGVHPRSNRRRRTIPTTTSAAPPTASAPATTTTTNASTSSAPIAAGRCSNAHAAASSIPHDRVSLVPPPQRNAIATGTSRPSRPTSAPNTANRTSGHRPAATTSASTSSGVVGTAPSLTQEPRQRSHTLGTGRERRRAHRGSCGRSLRPRGRRHAHGRVESGDRRRTVAG
jgi:hypothetical protein